MIYRFDGSVLDTARRELRRDAVVRPLEPQVYELLLFLLENRHRVVGREELNATIWHGRPVTDAALNSRIKAVRAAVGDDGRSQRIIRTHHRRGYRFSAAVALTTDHLAAASTPDRTDRGAGAALPGRVEPIVAAAQDLDEVDLSLPGQPSLAVLPLRIAGDPGPHGELADALTHDIITQLARARWLFVAARGSAFRFANGPYHEHDVGRALGVRYVVQGMTTFKNGNVDVQAALADTVTGEEIWADRFHRSLDDIVAIQEEMADLIVGVIESEVEHSERQRAALLTPDRLDAWGAYHRGCWHMYRFTRQDYDLAESFFQRALALTPNSPRPYAGLSFVHWQRAFLEYGDYRDESSKALEYAEECLALDPREPHAHWALGRARLLQQDLDGAVEELEHCVALNPSSAMGQYSLSYALMQNGQGARSNSSVARARRLSPYDAMTFAMYAVQAQNLLFQRQFGDATRYATRAAQQPTAHYHVVAIAAVCNVMHGDLQTAGQLLARLRAERPDYTAEDYLQAFNHRIPANVSLIQQAFARLQQV